MQDLFKPSIRLEENTLARLPEGFPKEGESVSIPGTPPGEGSPMPISGANLRASAKPITADPGRAGELVAIVEPPSPEADWRKPIAEYLHLGMLPDEETETRCLACRAKGYLIHDN
jgi:hypothetical protein